MPLLFSEKMKTDYRSIAVEWKSVISEKEEKILIDLHLQSFLDMFQGHTEAQLGLPTTVTKKYFLLHLIEKHLERVRKGEAFLATAAIEEQMVGFILCDDTAPHFSRRLEGLGCECNSLYIHILAAKQWGSLKSTVEKMRVGIGQVLLEALPKRFPAVRQLTLSVRTMNTRAQAFYATQGFVPYAQSNEHYMEYKKTISLGSQKRP